MKINGNELPDGFRRIVSEKSGKVTFEVLAGVVNGTKVRKQFGEALFGSEGAALAAAKHWYADKRGEIRRDRSAVLAVSDRNRLAYQEAIERLKPYKKTLLQAVNAAIELWKEEAGAMPVTMREATHLFLEHKRIANLTEDYRKNLEIYLNALNRDFGDTLVSRLTAAQLQEWLLKRETIKSPISWNNWRRNLEVFFNFCIDDPNRWTKSNPASALPIKKKEKKLIAILEVAEARRVLKAAMEICPRQIPWLVLGMFGGFRRKEADRAKWENFDWDGGVVDADPTKTSGSGHRWVDLNDALKAFLMPFRKEAGPVCTDIRERRADLRKLREATGIAKLNENVYRHSFASYHYKMYEDIGKSMVQMGHTNPKTFEDWYRRAIKTIEAHAYWAIRSEVKP